MNELNLTTPSLLFSAISLILLAYTNRFLSYASVIRTLNERYQENPDKDPTTLGQIRNFVLRLRLIRAMQTFGATSLLLCLTSMFFFSIGQHFVGEIIFGAGMVSLAVSLALCIWEIQISTDAIGMHLQNIRRRQREQDPYVGNSLRRNANRREGESLGEQNTRRNQEKQRKEKQEREEQKARERAERNAQPERAQQKEPTERPARQPRAERQEGQRSERADSQRNEKPARKEQNEARPAETAQTERPARQPRAERQEGQRSERPAQPQRKQAEEAVAEETTSHNEQPAPAVSARPIRKATPKPQSEQKPRQEESKPVVEAEAERPQPRRFTHNKPAEAPANEASVQTEQPQSLPAVQSPRQDTKPEPRPADVTPRQSERPEPKPAVAVPQQSPKQEEKTQPVAVRVEPRQEEKAEPVAPRVEPQPVAPRVEPQPTPTAKPQVEVPQAVSAPISVAKPEPQQVAQPVATAEPKPERKIFANRKAKQEASAEPAVQEERKSRYQQRQLERLGENK